jgi:Ras-related protein Rab-1A
MDFDAHEVPLTSNKNVGKTSISARFTTDRYVAAPTSTVGVASVRATLSCNDEKLTINSWDTVGQERFGSLCRRAGPI